MQLPTRSHLMYMALQQLWLLGVHASRQTSTQRASVAEISRAGSTTWWAAMSSRSSVRVEGEPQYLYGAPCALNPWLNLSPYSHRELPNLTAPVLSVTSRAPHVTLHSAATIGDSIVVQRYMSNASSGQALAWCLKGT